MSRFLASHSSAPELVRAIFKPLIRFCLRHGLKLQDINGPIRDAFLECAQEELKDRGDSLNASKLCALTGVRRQDIMKMLKRSKARRNEPTDGDLRRALRTPKQSKGSVLMKILGLWSTKSKYLDQEKIPRNLTCEGVENEFKDLVQSVSSDLSPYTVLNELEHLGIVIKENGTARLMRSVYEPSDETLFGLGILSEDLRFLIQAVDENVFDKPSTKNLHIQTSFDNIPFSKVEKIKQWIMQKGNLFHEEVRIFLSEHDRDVNGSTENISDDRCRVVVSSFGLSEVLEESEKRENE